MALRNPGDRFGRTLCDDPAATAAAFRAKIDNVIGRLDHFQIVLDDDDRVALIDERLQNVEQSSDILEMQAGGRFVQNVERTARRPSRQLFRKFDPLRLAAGQGCGLLSDMDVTKPDPLQGHHLVTDRRNRLEGFRRLIDRHGQHVGDGMVLERDLQGLSVIALPFAGIALDVNVRQEMHLDLDDTVALAGLAASAFDVEGEPARRVAAGAGLWKVREPFADWRERAGIGRWVRARRPADWLLIDVDDLVQQFDPVDPAVLAGQATCAVQLTGECPVKGIDDKGRFAAAGYTGHTGEHAQRKRRGDIVEVVFDGAFYFELIALVRLTPLLGNLDLAHTGQILPGQTVGATQNIVRQTRGHDMAAMDAGTRSHIDQVIRFADGFLVMLDDDNGVAEIAQALEGCQ